MYSNRVERITVVAEIVESSRAFSAESAHILACRPKLVLSAGMSFHPSREFQDWLHHERLPPECSVFCCTKRFFQW